MKCGATPTFRINMPRTKGQAVLHYQQNKHIYTESTRKRYERNRNWLTDYLKDLACSRCGMADSRCFEFHHRDRATKEYNVSYLVIKGFSLDKLQKEITKCDLFCANCHRIVEWEIRNNAEIAHELRHPNNSANHC